MVASSVLAQKPEILDNYDIIFGPPGTGKTQTLMEIIEGYVKEYGPDSVMATSYTRGAAAELVSRVPSVPSSHVRTLHAFGYAAIGGNRKIAEQQVASWNKYCVRAGKSIWCLTATTASTASLDEEGSDDAVSSRSGASDGDNILASFNLARSRMQPQTLWPVANLSMYRAWKQWKDENNFVDFGDMIEIPLREQLPPPTRARFFIIDEAQDCSAQQLALIRLWGASMQRVVIALDDDQSLYYFSGGDPEGILDLPVPAQNRRVLAQSHRVPRQIHDFAQRWVQTIEKREPKDYFPRDFEGEVRYIEPNTAVIKDRSYLEPEALVEDALTRYLINGKSVMFLATCSYMLSPLIAVLRKRGVPFHNPYRAQRNDWNPLTPQHGVASSKRLLSYLRPQHAVWGEQARMWNIEEFLEWTDALLVEGVLRTGMRKKAENYLASLNGDRDLIARELEVNDEQLGRWLTDEALGAAMDGDLDWFEKHLSSSKSGGMKLPLAIAREQGPHRLMERPLVVVGTIHSVKGAQADAVYLFPDISLAANKSGNAMSMRQLDQIRQSGGSAYAEFMARDHRMRADSTKRTFYVGITRARESLIICPPAPGTYKSQSPHVDLVNF